MIAFAQSFFTLQRPQSDGRTLAQHLESVKKQTGKTPAQLAEAKELPGWAGGVWGAFVDLSPFRQWSNGAPSPLMPTEITAWQSLSGTLLSPIEYRLICDLDTEYRKAATNG